MKQNILNTEIEVINNKVNIIKIKNIDYISLTDLAKFANQKDPSGVIRNWMSNQNSFAFYSLWEELNNKNFNSVELHGIKSEVGYNRFTMTPSRWHNEFNAIGIICNRGKYSKGTFAHPDIAFEFASWISPEFKLYLITEFERLKKNEFLKQKQEWQANRELTKLNYLVQTNSIKENIVPNLTNQQKNYIFAEEADILNMALFGVTAKEWRENNPNLSRKGNIRDYADLLYLIILSNMENINAELIKLGLSQKERLIILNESAKNQIKIFKKNNYLNN